MSLSLAYEAFLKSSSANQLNVDASLHYITTLTTINKSTEIAKHLSKQEAIVRRKQEKILSRIEGGNAICLDVETTLEFKTGGGAYLPGLEDNFLSERVVTFPIVHIVHFDSQGKIQQIRQYWDQGSLLKLVEVIGSRARNWPIRDGKDQIRLISQSVSHTTKDDGLGTTVKQIGDVTITSRPSSPRKNANNVTRDPHASLSLFQPRDDNRDDTYTDKGIAPRASAKPASRDYHDLFVGSDSKDRPPSPTKEDGLGAPKYGAGKNFQPSRLFNTEQPEPIHASPVKVHPSKYNHFEFADGSEEPRQPTKPRAKSKHQSQWDFADFATPEKIPQRRRPQDEHHFGFGDEEEKEKTASPTKPTKPAQPRRDAETHFEFKDDGAPVGDRPAGHPRGAGASNGTALYKNYLFEEEGAPVEEKKGHRPVSSVTSVKDRKKDFDPHFELTDAPGLGEKTASDNNRPIPENRLKAVKMMNSQWEATDTNSTASTEKKGQAPSSPSMGKENMSIAIAGDGMGSRKGVAPREQQSVGIKTGGDGMGGRKGAASTWGFGDETDEFGAAGGQADKFRAGKKQQGPKDNSFWDF